MSKIFDHRTGVLVLAALCTALTCGRAATQDPVAQTAATADPTTELFRGTLFVGGGGRLPDEIFDAFAETAGGLEGTLVVIPTASGRADTEEGRERTRKAFVDDGWNEVLLLHTRDREVAEDPEFSAMLDSADAVWISGGDQNRLSAAYRGTKVQERLLEVLARGGVVGGSSAGAAIVSDPMIGGGREEPRIVPGLGLLPGVFVDQHFAQRNRLRRLRAAVDSSGRPGVGIDEGTCLVVRGRSMRVLGEGNVQIVLPGDPVGDDSERLCKRGERLDLVQLRRAAANRVAGRLDAPDAWVGPAKGTLLVGGGGRLPAEAYRRFLEAAGGADQPIVVVPTAIGGGAMRSGERTASSLRRLGAKSVTVFHQTDRRLLADPEWRKENLADLREARGIWFTGGRQWRLVDAYAGTLVESLFQDVLGRGGVIAGSSAGASIQAELLVRGHPLGNRIMEAEGYLRGFAYLGGVGVDQHFTERKRRPDLERVVGHHPGWLGIGLDEGTLIDVRNGRVEVFGRGGATFLCQPGEGSLRARVLEAGESVELAALRREWLSEVDAPEAGDVDRKSGKGKERRDGPRELERSR